MRMAEHAIPAETSTTIKSIVVRAVLRDLHDQINALGGVPANEYERGSNATVGKALAILEAKQSEVFR